MLSGRKTRFRTVCLYHKPVDFPLFQGILKQNRLTYRIYNMVGRRGYAQAVITVVAVSQFYRLKFSRGCAGWHSRTSYRPILQGNLRLYCGISAGIQNLPSFDTDNFKIIIHRPGSAPAR